MINFLIIKLQLNDIKKNNKCLKKNIININLNNIYLLKILQTTPSLFVFLLNSK